jgi:hypothetical protein
MRFSLAIAMLAACGGTPAPTPGPAPTPTTMAAPSPEPSAKPAPPPVCDAAVPAAACKRGALRTCKADDPQRVGEWRYALALPLYATLEDVTTERLVGLWKTGDPALGLAASAETQAALTAVLGPPGAHVATIDPATAPEKIVVDATHAAIVPADQLVPNWKTISLDGKHPLERQPNGLAVPLCAPTAPAAPIANIDPKRLTVLAMTGTTALTRYTAKLMNEKGVLYPLTDIEPWLAAADLVHVSNEVSFVPNCDAGTKATMSFCSKESYIELLEKSHVKIVELTGSHLHDYGRAWIDHTLAMYAKRGWVWFGGGKNQVEATAPAFVEHAGNKLALLGCNMVRTTSRVITAGPGTAACDLARMTWQIRDLRARGFTVIVSVQHEEVYVEDPPLALVIDLRVLASAGATYVMGSQAHSPHPWEVHRGAFVHYGPGNLYFDQFWHPVRDAAHDKLYLHAGKLLTVGHLYTRTEERGRPRLHTAAERAVLLRDLAAALRRLPPAVPWGAPIEAPASRTRPDSILIGGSVQSFALEVPSKLEDGKRYPLVIELGASPTVADDGAFVAIPGKRVAGATTQKLVDGITALVAAKYPVDPGQVTVHGGPTKSRK